MAQAMLAGRWDDNPKHDHACGVHARVTMCAPCPSYGGMGTPGDISPPFSQPPVTG